MQVLKCLLPAQTLGKLSCFEYGEEDKEEIAQQKHIEIPMIWHCGRSMEIAGKVQLEWKKDS